MSESKKNFKYVFKIIAITFVVTLFSITILFGAFSLAMPRAMAELSYGLGMKKYASSLYYNAYQKDNNVDDIYNALMLSISCNDNESIIRNFEVFEKDVNFFTKINKIDFYNESNESTSLLIDSSIRNIENYLKNRYVKSLLIEKKVDRASIYAKANFNYDDFSINNLGNYLFSNFVQDNNFEIFNEKLNEIDPDTQKICNYLYSYICDLHSLLNGSYDFENKNDFPKYIELCNRIILVSSNIKAINNKAVFLNDSELANINTITLNSNNKIKEMVA